eukprot:TRINITY_DN341_c1_g2_i1.p1 TRINITY_DN341_c1_g2~~TRINITY_DN341_c1_g2_i1.p1  ORF type:complete len:253 (+),score=67.54 TRINITY_DN341_c1_g2_i1:72-830(+)
MNIYTKVLVLCCLFCASHAATEVASSNSTDSTAVANTSKDPRDADVYLNVSVSVDLIQLIVEKVNVSLNLDLKAASLVQLNAGVSASIDKINLTITKVKANVELVVHLDNVATIVGDTLETINKNPQIITGLVQAIGNLVGSVTGVLSQTVNSLGQVVKTVVDTAGNIVEQTLDKSGSVASSSSLGNLSSLPVVSSTVNTAGQTVSKLKSTDGSILQVVYDKAGNVVSVDVISKGSTPSPSPSPTTSTTTGA